MKAPGSRGRGRTDARPAGSTEAATADLPALLRRIESAEAATREGLADLSRAMIAAADRLDARLGRIEARAEFALEASLLSAASLEGDLAALRTRMERAPAAPPGPPAEMREVAALLGARFAELEHRLEDLFADADRLSSQDAPVAATRAAEPDVWHVRPLHEVRRRLAEASAARDPEPIRPEAPPASLADILVHAEDFTAGGTDRGRPFGSAAIGRDGDVRAKASGTFGIVTPRYAFAGGAIAEIAVEIGGTAGVAGAPRLVLASGDGERMGPDIPIEEGGASARFTIPSAVSDLTLRIVAEAAGPEARFTLRALRILRCDPDRHRERVRARVGEPVLASLASIPSRRALLRDCVASLLPQCDAVRVFLNGYEDVPDFLDHPRIEVRRSQDFDDRGDAGKMFWIDRDRDRPGYRLIADDDLIFPPDFAQAMCAKVAAHGNRAIFATHGVLLRQPIERYYETSSRAATFHFASALARDRAVHIGATNALAFHSSAVEMSWSDFQYRNSADVWLSLEAQRRNLPVFTPARPAHWIREGRQPDGETIYAHSLKRTGSRFDSSAIQDAVLRKAAPLTIGGRHGGARGLVVALDGSTDLDAALDGLGRLDADGEWVVFLAFDRSDAELGARVATSRIPHETHLVDTGGDPAKGLAEVARLAVRLALEKVQGLPDGAALPPGADASPKPEPAPTVNALFERVLVLNLDRRPDRWEAVQRELAAAGIRAEREVAVDGQAEGTRAEYEAYARSAPVTVSPSMPTIRFSEDLYMRYESQNQRVAHLEAAGGKAIRSAGAWGYLRSYERILERAIADRVDSLLVFDDDVVLHKDLPALFAQAVRELPDDWLILQLGTLQYNWSPPWTQWRSSLLYGTNGSAVGSHAVGLRFGIMPFLLDQTRRMDMPFDIGPLSAATRHFADRCFVIHPNLAIQRLADSDIGTSVFQEGAGAAAAAATYRWDFSAYGAPASAGDGSAEGGPAAGRTAGPFGRVEEIARRARSRTRKGP